jgi:hypothetical protein
LVRFTGSDKMDGDIAHAMDREMFCLIYLAKNRC